MSPDLVRTVSSTLRLQVTAPADLVFSVAVAADQPPTSETLSITVDGALLDRTEILAAGQTRLHRVASAPVGSLVMQYDAVVPLGDGPAPLTELESIEFTRPSRYCDSDRLSPVAHSHFGHLEGAELVQEAVSWVLTHITYAPGSSGPVDGALETYLRRRGICRDTSQLVIAFLRALGVPARLVSVYAPGLQPMDFHAVTEVAIDGQWYVVDATGLAPRGSLLRIATGRDAADTAFLTVNGGFADLVSMQVEAVVEPGLPADDGLALTQLR
ncbi:transglutaminase-like domain-containing protein [Nocardioides currus]|uniref:Transglutaminase n=1 Tax=Nocardioides currus TaxID=2133958 RepID=A0A2R7YWK8_9ACTN|nr:transglutaminase family protein [Nocardioides currus]PUA80694.1 transglutaminase [Nocardioides currus]